MKVLRVHLFAGCSVAELEMGTGSKWDKALCFAEKCWLIVLRWANNN